MVTKLQSLPEVVSSIADMRIEMFRGDSFQIGVKEAGKSLKVAIAIRAYLRSNRFIRSNQQWDARMAIGIGSLDYEYDTLATSDGEAYRVSGRGLDDIGKAHLYIETPWKDINYALLVSTAFADDVISGWTQSQSKAIFQSLATGMNHTEIAGCLGVSRQMIDKSLRAAKESLINLYIQQFEQLINLKIG